MGVSKITAFSLSGITAVTWIISFLNNGFTPRFLATVSILTLIAIISFIDIRERRIPNLLLLALLVISIPVIVFSLFEISWKSHFIGMAIGTAVFILPALFGSGVGAGDVKYLGVTGLILGYEGIMEAMIILAVTLILWIAYRALRGQKVLKTKIPLAPFISVAFAVVLLV